MKNSLLEFYSRITPEKWIPGWNRRKKEKIARVISEKNIKEYMMNYNMMKEFCLDTGIDIGVKGEC